MPLEVIALLIVFAGGAFAGVGIERLLSARRRRAWRNRNRHRWDDTRREAGAGPGPRPREQDSRKQPDAADQLRIVMGASFAIQPLLNKSEARVFKELDRIVLACNPTWHVMAQVSLGEILRSRDAVAFSCVNSKRVDLLLVDSDCQPRHAIEYQGGSHHQGTAAARDAVKKEALRRAGIGYHEVVAGHTTPADLRQLIEKLVDRPDAYQRQ
ncbi:MAG: DUF2726 domain-containing protein [Reyranellaceae bacterium]